MNETSLENHYKDRTPEETCEIILDFFKSRGYDVLLELTDKSIAGTYGYKIELTKNRHFILFANGKGMSQIYAKASGLAELYERFCSKCPFFANPIAEKAFEDFSYQKYGYYYCKDEKILDNALDLMTTPDVKDFYSRLLPLEEEKKAYFKMKLNGRYTAVPFKNLINPDSEPLYANLSLINDVDGSNGLAAGNTFYEAINQGASELLERQGVRELSMANKTFYSVPIDAVKNQQIKNILKGIEADNNKCYILDLSYTYNIPVLGLIIFNKTTHNITVNLGSFPVFDIALERCCTEIYQNIVSRQHLNFGMEIPLKSSTFEECYQKVYKGNSQNIFFENILSKIEEKDCFNEKGYLMANNYSNEEIFHWIVNKFVENNFGLYYYDYSLIENMKSIRVYSPEISYTAIISTPSDWNQKNHMRYIKSLDVIYQSYVNYTNNIDQEKNFIKIMQYCQLMGYDEIFFNAMQTLNEYPFLDFGRSTKVEKVKFYKLIYRIYSEGLENFTISELKDVYDISFFKTFWSYQDAITKYTSIAQYVKTGKYSNKEIYDILKHFGDMEEFKDCTSFKAVLQDHEKVVKDMFFKNCSDPESFLKKEKDYFYEMV